MGAYGHATPPLLKAIFFNYRFDLTKNTLVSQNFMGANCNAKPPLLKAIFFDYRFDLTKNPPSQNFMSANCNATPPLLKAIFFDYRFDLTNFDQSPPPAKISQVHFVTLHLC